MTSRQRVFAALRGETPDRVPHMEMYIDSKVIEALQPGLSYHDFVEWADIDGVACLAVVEPLDRVQWVDREKALFRDKWGALQALCGEEFLPMVREPARIESEHDLSGYTPPDPRQAAVLDDAKVMVERFAGERALIAVGEATFAPTQFLRGGLQNLMFDYIERPTLVEKLARIAADYHIELYRLLLDMGVEIIVLGDDYAGKTGPMMSPAHFDRFILPELKRVIAAVKERGGFVIKHTDGNIWPIKDRLVAAGVDMLGPLEPAHMDLQQVRDTSDPPVGVLGNVDVDLLSRGTPQRVREVTRALIARVSPGGRHIVSSGNTIASYVNPENYMAMIETVREWGRYPIRA